MKNTALLGAIAAAFLSVTGCAGRDTAPPFVGSWKTIDLFSLYPSGSPSVLKRNGSMTFDAAGTFTVSGPKSDPQISAWSYDATLGKITARTEEDLTFGYFAQVSGSLFVLVNDYSHGSMATSIMEKESSTAGAPKVEGTWKVVGMYRCLADPTVEKVEEKDAIFSFDEKGTGRLLGFSKGRQDLVFAWEADPASNSFTLDSGDWRIEGCLEIRGDTLVLAATFPGDGRCVYVLERALGN